MPRKGYSVRLSALQIQALVSLEDKLGDMGQDPILQSIFVSVRDTWNEQVIPTEMGQKPVAKAPKKPVAEVPTEQEIKQFELKQDEPLAEGTKQLVETMSDNHKEAGKKK
jgi:hypothetical protein